MPAFRPEPEGMTVAMAVVMVRDGTEPGVAVMAVAAAARTGAARPQRRAHGLDQHVDTDADDDEEARRAHAWHVRKPEPEAAPSARGRPARR